jgi:hypothetical protein
VQGLQAAATQAVDIGDELNLVLHGVAVIGGYAGQVCRPPRAAPKAHGGWVTG